MNDVKASLLKCGALLEGHFLLSSGRHSGQYCQCAKLLQYPDDAAKVLSIVANGLKDTGIAPTVICGPAMGGIIVAYELARQLGVPSIFTERVDGEMALRRGFSLQKGDKVVIAEDVVTTGKSTLETIKVIEAQGAEVVAVICIVNRSKSDTLAELPLISAIALDIESYDADDCPLCRSTGTRPEKPGSRGNS